MKTTRSLSGAYIITGYTKAGNLVKYKVQREGSGWYTIGWFVELVCGDGQAFKTIFNTKAQAVQAIADQ